MGFGKTLQAIATLAALEAFPALILTKAVTRLGWKRV